MAVTGLPFSPAGCHVLRELCSSPPCFLRPAEVFFPEEAHAAAPADFLQELPSYRSVLRRRAGPGGGHDPQGSLGARAGEAWGPQPEGAEPAARPLREYALSIAEKRRIR